MLTFVRQMATIVPRTVYKQTDVLQDDKPHVSVSLTLYCSCFVRDVSFCFGENALKNIQDFEDKPDSFWLVRAFGIFKTRLGLHDLTFTNGHVVRHLKGDSSANEL